MALTDLSTMTIPEVKITEAEILSNLIFPSAEGSEQVEAGAEEGRSGELER